MRARTLATAGQRAEALQILEARLASAPDDRDARLWYGIVLSWDRQFDRARTELQRVLAVDPNNSDAREALANVERWSRGEQRPQREARVGASYDDYGAEAFQEVFVSMRMRTAAGPLVGRVAHADYFDEDTQVEAELYPRIGNRAYAYLAAGLSGDGDAYPDTRLAGEVFATLGAGFEVSGGARWLDFDSGDVTVWTASVSRYFGNWLAGVRAYESDNGNALQGYARRYFGDQGEYVGLRIGEGTSREDVRTSADVEAFETTEVAVEALKVLRGPWLVQGRAGWRDDGPAVGVALGYRY